MVQQLDRLREMTARSKIEVLVVPADTWNHPGLDSGFKLLRVPDAGLMLYQETRVGAELSSSNR
ncbi:Scr1 family TA system antitoxin-like transcriptional regulator [Haloactinospora alba]|uniref:Scr1 family TA system antitoxin-like transcriptional regulator n=1 Tax=Haloactinospora alba TaxID=405555 RepID=UPI00319E9C8A